MLQFILGTSGTGKSTLVLNKMAQLATNREKCVLIVPEQFSSTSELAVFRALGDEKSAFVSVYSFRSFCGAIENKSGGGARKTVTDANRVVLVRRGVNKLEGELKLYKKNSKSAHFCEMCAAAIKEFKIAGATPGSLLAVNSKNAKTGEKLAELGQIYAAYEAVLGQTGLEATDRILHCAKVAQESFFAGTHFFIDNFDGFTAPEYKLIERFIADGKNCTVTLCANSLFDEFNGLGLFSSVQKAANRLMQIAKKNDVGILKEENLSKNLRAKNEELCFVDDFIRNEEKLVPSLKGNVTVNVANDIYAEVRTVSAQIHKLALNGTRYNEIAVICRDTKMYKSCITKYFKEFDIPFFCDENETAEFMPLAGFVRATIAVLRDGVTTKPILALLKTGLTSFDETTISELENYAFVWELKAADWQNEFTKNPDGLTDKLTTQASELLEKLENARKAIVPRLTAFNTQCKGKETGEIIKEIYFLIKDFNLEENTLNLIEKQKAEGDTFAADDTLKMWDTTIDLLDALNDMLAGDEVLPQELDEFFVLLLRATEVGKSPRARQAVLFGQADRVRLDNVVHSFILGLNEGVFPAEVGFSGLLNHEDREALVQSGIEMPGAFENRVLLEDMFLYRALTSASQSVSLFYHKEGAGGGAEPSSLLCKLMETASFPSLDLEVEDFASTKSAALDVLGENYRAENELAPTLIKALCVNDEYKKILNKMEKEALNPQFSVTKTEVLGKIIGDEIKISPSRVESFYNCRFAYFLKYILKVEPRRKAQMDVMQTGTFVHYILENAIKQGGANFAQLEKNDLEKIVADLCEKYMQEKLKGLEITKRMQSLLKRLCDNAVSLLLFIVEEQKQSEFKPIGFEVPIFDGEEIKPLEFKTNNGKTVKIIGEIDRVDAYKNDKGETFIRVIDYKTGDKKFNLEEIYNGLNMQMLLYLFTFIDDKKIEDLNISEAGVIYLLSDPTPKMSMRGETGEAKEGYAVDGLIVSNDEIIDKMDKDRTGRFVPLSFSKNGECTQASIDKHLASLEKLGRIKVHVEKLVVQMAQELARGNIAAKPLKNGEKLPCNFCEYSSVCRHENGKNEGELDRNVNFSQTETEDGFDLTKAEEKFDLTEKKEVSENAKLD